MRISPGHHVFKDEMKVSWSRIIFGSFVFICFEKLSKPVYRINTVMPADKTFADSVINKFGDISVDHNEPPSDHSDAAVFTYR